MDFANSFGSRLEAATIPSSRARNFFRDGSWLTGRGSWLESPPKEGCAVCVVNQIFPRRFLLAQPLAHPGPKCRAANRRAGVAELEFPRSKFRKNALPSSASGNTPATSRFPAIGCRPACASERSEESNRTLDALRRAKSELGPIAVKTRTVIARRAAMKEFSWIAPTALSAAAARFAHLVMTIG